MDFGNIAFGDLWIRVEAVKDMLIYDESFLVDQKGTALEGLLNEQLDLEVFPQCPPLHR